MAPIEKAKTSISDRSSAPRNVAASAAAASMVSGTCPEEAPAPGWSKVMTRRVAAVASMMRGSQLSRLAPRWLKKTTGMSPRGPSSR